MALCIREVNTGVREDYQPVCGITILELIFPWRLNVCFCRLCIPEDKEAKGEPCEEDVNREERVVEEDSGPATATRALLHVRAGSQRHYSPSFSTVMAL